MRTTLGKPLGKRIAWVAWAALLPMSTLAAGEFEGFLEVGAREVSVSGDDAKYRQHVNLDDGLRVLGAGLRYRPGGDNGRAPDLVELRVAGLGGDPHQSVAFQLREYGVYRFRYDRRESDYFYQDLLIDPSLFASPEVIEGARGGDFHHFDFERVRDTLRLDLDLGARAKLNFDYERYEKRGDSTTVYDVSREEFELERPIDEENQSFSVGFSYAWDKATFTWTERVLDYDNASSVLLPGFSDGSEPNEPTALDFFFFRQPYDREGREHQFRLLARPTSALELRVDALLSDYELDLDISESAQGIDFRGLPFAREVEGAGTIDRDTVLLEFAAGYAVTDRLRLVGSVRRNRLDQDSALTFGADMGSGEWEINTDAFEAGLEAAIGADLHLGLGWASERRESRFVQSADAVVDAADVDTERDGYYVDVAYRPDSRLSVSLTFEDNSLDDPFTLASATDSQRIRLRGRYRWDNGTSVTASYRRTEMDNDVSDWFSKTSQTDLRVAHTAARWSVALGASWVNLDREIDQRVPGIARQDLFAIDYEADASFVDAAAQWRAKEWLRFGGSFRRYDNDGSFSARRDDLRAFVEVEVLEGYDLRLSYRNVDFEEGDLESFDVDVWELALVYDW